MGGGEPAGALRKRGPAPALPGGRALSLPLALLAAATAADLLGTLADARLLWTAGAYLGIAGVIAGALACGVRLARLAGDARTGSAGGRPLAAFALLAALALGLFALAAWVRGDAAIPPDPAILLAEPFALALLWLSSRIDRR